MTDPIQIGNLESSKRPVELTAEEAETTKGGWFAMFSRGMVTKLMFQGCDDEESTNPNCYLLNGPGIDYSGAEPEE